MRVFVTVGNSLKRFDRLLQAVERTLEAVPAPRTGSCQHGPSEIRPPALRPVAFLGRDEFEHELRSADIVITHGGVGTLATAVRAGHRPIVMARLSRHDEIVNDHQLEIIRELSRRGLVRPVSSESELRDVLVSLGPSGTRGLPEGRETGDRLRPIREDLRTAVGLGRPRPWAAPILRLLAAGAPAVMPVERPRERDGTSRPEPGDRS